MSESVKVAVRCRPISQRELQQGSRNVVTIDSTTRSCTLDSSSNGGTGKVYQFDAAYGSESTTEAVYEDVGSVVVEAVLEGYNATVFAYGQTGCGKSYTMRGFIERSLEHLFEATSTSSSETRYLALLSYLEIYNERLRDLLQDGNAEGIDHGLLQLKEDNSRGTYVAGGLREITVKNAADCARLVEQGDRKRAAAATRMNAASSRSHAVLTLALEAIAINENDKRGSAVRRGRLHLVDLAGSERQARTGATGDRLREAASINLSLSALGNVISALAAGNGRHVPYRDSKLTRLLKDSLGGNARTLMIACVSPCDVDAEETLSTLRYAARARCIKNKPVVNEDPKDALLRQYQLELQQLRKLLESSDSTRVNRLVLTTTEEEEEEREERYEEEVERLRRECENSNLSAQRLQEELTALRSRFEGLSYVNVADVEDKIEGRSGVEVGQEQEQERIERRRRKRELARKEVMRRLERLTIGGEARGDAEARKRRERRRKRLEALAGALEASEVDGNGAGAFEVYGQLKSTEDALRRMAKRAKQLEAEATDLQASWDAERRDLLRKELLATQLCDAMIPHLRPGCPFRDLAAVRAAANWCDELGRWRLPDVSPHIPLPPPSLSRDNAGNSPVTSSEPDHNNNNDSNKDSSRVRNEDGSEIEQKKMFKKRADIVDTYFRRSRIDTLLAHAREAKTFETIGRISKSGGSEDLVSGGNNCLQLNALNLQSSTPVIPDVNYRPQRQTSIGIGGGGWLASEDNAVKWISSQGNMTTLKKNPPRLLEALPSYPLGSISRISSRFTERTASPHSLHDDNNLGHHARSPTY